MTAKEKILKIIEKAKELCVASNGYGPNQFMCIAIKKAIHIMDEDMYYKDLCVSEISRDRDYSKSRPEYVLMNVWYNGRDMISRIENFDRTITRLKKEIETPVSKEECVNEILIWNNGFSLKPKQ